MSDARIPNAKEIAQLPRWARVAFAARCARWVLPAFESWKGADSTEAVRRAIRLAEAFAATNKARSAAAAGATAHRALVATCNAAITDAARGAGLAAHAAAHVTWAALTAEALATHSTKSRRGRTARARIVALDARAVSFTTTAARIAYDVAPVEIRSELDRVLTATKAEGWTDATRLAREFFGPI